MAFAIIETGGKQYKVSEGDVITVEKIGDHQEGDSVVFDRVLLVDNAGVAIGTPTLTGASVTGVIKKAGKHDKIRVIKYKAKSRYFKKRGHRQPFHEVSITGIKG